MPDALPKPGPDLTPRQLKLRKFLVLLLQHRPARFPLPTDAEGFVSLAEILRLLHGLPNFRWATRADVLTIISVPRPPYFELRDERLRIRQSVVDPTAPVNPEKCGTMEQNKNASSKSA